MVKFTNKNYQKEVMNTQMEAEQLQVLVVGRCGRCNRFRNNMKWRIENKHICPECFLTLRNQKIITSTKIAPTIPSVTTEKPKPRKGYNIQDRVNNLYNLISSADYTSIRQLKSFGHHLTIEKYLRILEEEGKIKTAKIKHELYISISEKAEVLKQLQESNITLSKGKSLVEKKLLSVILQSANPMSVAEIMEADDFNRIYCYTVLKRLVKEKKIAKLEKVKTSYYISPDKKHLLRDLIGEKEEVIYDNDNVIKIKIIESEKKVSKSRGLTIDTIVKIIKESTTVLDSSIFSGSKFCIATGIRTIRALGKSGSVVLSNYARGQKLYFCDANKPELVKQIEEINNNQTHVKILNYLRSTNEYQSINDIINAIKGVNINRWGGGVYRYFKKVIQKLDCETLTNNVGTYYRLKK